MRHTVTCQIKHDGSYGLIGSDIGSITNNRDILLRKQEFVEKHHIPLRSIRRCRYATKYGQRRGLNPQIMPSEPQYRLNVRLL